MKTPVGISSKLPSAGTSIFSVMTALANEHMALNMAQGFPDFTCHPALKEKVAHYINKDFNQYAPMPGVMALREAIAEKTEKLYSKLISVCFFVIFIASLFNLDI